MWWATHLRWSGRGWEHYRCLGVRQMRVQFPLPPSPQASGFISTSLFSHLQGRGDSPCLTELLGVGTPRQEKDLTPHARPGQQGLQKCQVATSGATQLTGHLSAMLEVSGLRTRLGTKSGCPPSFAPTFWLGVKGDRDTPLTPGAPEVGAGLGPCSHPQLIGGAFAELQGKEGDTS